jgi:hypothetical protein
VSAVLQGRIVKYKLIDFLVSQVLPEVLHLGMFSSAGFERQKLLTKINAVLSCDVGYLNVVPDTVQPVAWSAGGSSSRVPFRLLAFRSSSGSLAILIAMRLALISRSK